MLKISISFPRGGAREMSGRPGRCQGGQGLNSKERQELNKGEHEKSQAEWALMWAAEHQEEGPRT